MTNTSINDQLIEIIFLLPRIIKEEMSFDADASQLTMLQLQALIFIKKNKILSMSDVANQFKISLPTATVLSDKLVNAGLIRRIRSEKDRRIVDVSLTEKGEDLFKKAMKQQHQKINKLLSYFSLEDKKQLFRILKNFSVNIQKAYEK